MTATRERAINLRDWEVRAIQAGRLKLLVRPVKPQPYRDTEMRHTMFVGGTVWVRNGKLKADWAHAVKNPESMIQFCPYGQPGDRLRGREAYGYAWMNEQEVQESIELGEGPSLFYRADWPDQKVQPSIADRWLSSSRMPRWAVRNWLEITEVRCGRVRETSEEEAIAGGAGPSHPSIDKVSREFGYPDFSRSMRAQIYEMDYGEGAWERDWVWMIGVKRIEGGGAK